MKRFRARFEILHRPHPNPWTCAFWPSVVHSVAFQHQFSFPSVGVDPVSVSLFVLVVTLDDCSRDFVDPRFPEDERGCVRSRDLDLSSLLERLLCSADGGGPADGDDGSYLRFLHLIHHQVLE